LGFKFDYAAKKDLELKKIPVIYLSLWKAEWTADCHITKGSSFAINLKFLQLFNSNYLSQPSVITLLYIEDF